MVMFFPLGLCPRLVRHAFTFRTAKRLLPRACSSPVESLHLRLCSPGSPLSTSADSLSSLDGAGLSLSNDGLHEGDSLPPRRNSRVRVPVKCVENLDADLADRLTTGNLSRKFKLEAVKEELDFLTNEIRYPLPEELSEAQWTALLDLEEQITRYKYLNAMLDGREEEIWDELQEEEEMWRHGLRIDDDVVQELVGDDEDKKQRLEEIYREHEKLRQAGVTVPVKLRPKDLRDMLHVKDLEELEKALRFRAFTFRLGLKDRVIKKAKQIKGAQKKLKEREERENDDHLVYHLGNNTIFLRIFKRDMNPNLNWRVLREYQPEFEAQPLVIDLQYTSTMTLKNARSMLMKEVLMVLTENRSRHSPAPLYFVNYRPDCHACQMMLDHMPTLMNADEPVVITEKSYLDLFPKERLLYLSPDSKNDMWEHDASDVYIVAALNDKAANHSPTTLAQAKREGIRHARLPTKRVHGRATELTTNAVANVLADFRFSKNWEYALRWVPPRFFRYQAMNDDTVWPYYYAHHSLTPEAGFKNMDMYPAEYLRLYEERVAQYQREHNIRALPLAKNRISEKVRYSRRGDGDRGEYNNRSPRQHWRDDGGEVRHTKRQQWRDADDGTSRSKKRVPVEDILSVATPSSLRSRSMVKKKSSVRDLLSD